MKIISILYFFDKNIKKIKKKHKILHILRENHKKIDALTVFPIILTNIQT